MKAGAALLAAACLAAGVATADEVTTGRQLFEHRCVGCHQLPEPDALTPTQWATVLQTMQKRMNQFGLTPLTTEEYEAVLTYLNTHRGQAP